MADGLLGDEEPRGDLRVRQPSRDELEDLRARAREPCGMLARRRRAGLGRGRERRARGASGRRSRRPAAPSACSVSWLRRRSSSSSLRASAMAASYGHSSFSQGQPLPRSRRRARARRARARGPSPPAGAPSAPPHGERAGDPAIGEADRDASSLGDRPSRIALEVRGLGAHELDRHELLRRLPRMSSITSSRSSQTPGSPRRARSSPSSRSDQDSVEGRAADGRGRLRRSGSSLVPSARGRSRRRRARRASRPRGRRGRVRSSRQTSLSSQRSAAASSLCADAEDESAVRAATCSSVPCAGERERPLEAPLLVPRSPQRRRSRQDRVADDDLRPRRAFASSTARSPQTMMPWSSRRATRWCGHVA